MIIQGSNVPVTLTFPVSLSGTQQMEVSLCTEYGKELKHWSRDQLNIEGCVVSCLLTQEETISFPVGECRIEVKWLDSTGATNFADVIHDCIAYRADQTVMDTSDA